MLLIWSCQWARHDLVVLCSYTLLPLLQLSLLKSNLFIICKITVIILLKSNLFIICKITVITLPHSDVIFYINCHNVAATPLLILV